MREELVRPNLSILITAGAPIALPVNAIALLPRRARARLLSRYGWTFLLATISGVPALLWFAGRVLT